MQLASTVWKETHAYSLNGLHLIWQYLHDLPNCQIKITTKYIMNTPTVINTYYYALVQAREKYNMPGIFARVHDT